MSENATENNISQLDRSTYGRKIKWKPIILAAGATGIGLVILTAFALLPAPATAVDAKSPDATLNSPVAVIVQRPLLEADLATRRFVAVVAARIETPHAFQVSGRVEARLVENGDIVTAGTPLARLVQADFELARQHAHAEVEAAKEALRVSGEDARRVLALRDSGTASVAALDAANRAYREANARLARAVAQLDLADNQLEYTILTAESDGIVIARAVEAGQVISAGLQVLTLAQQDNLEIVVAFPEGMPLPDIGAVAEFTPWSTPDQPIKAHLRELSPTADAKSHTFTARFSLDEAGALRIGSTGHLAIQLQAEGRVLVRVPSLAVYDPGTGEGSGLWRVTKTNQVEFVPALINRIDKSDALVEAALSPEDRIVALGANRLQAGQVIHAMERAPE